MFTSFPSLNFYILTLKNLENKMDQIWTGVGSEFQADFDHLNGCYFSNWQKSLRKSITGIHY